MGYFDCQQMQQHTYEKALMKIKNEYSYKREIERLKERNKQLEIENELLKELIRR